ncbi:transmembrane protein, putative [Rhizoctonia solani AG-3 Rhs1AP]|uniref:Transmembrane protein, putative n=1 Tax=Rhizoctonia solani AG-3 Rhs1AP TaxID=1086054 RepID=X8IZV3_9AGAM|nr:transmembrane protein, putative [Rhizoctonia solani AG-3 Rhs1AP]
MLGFWIITSINSLFILTVDLWRTSTYLGCITVQTALNLGLAIANLVNLLHSRNGAPQFIWFLHYPSPLMPFFAISILLVTLGSIFLFFTNLCLVAILCSHTAVSARQLWTIHAKDAYYGSVPHPGNAQALSVLGCSRKMPIKHPIFFFNKGFYARLFLRRVRPSETRTYALVRNSFAAAAIGLLLWRTITALHKAGNTISSRILSETCEYNAMEVHSIYILTERPTYGANSTYGDVEIAVSVSQSDTSENWEPSTTTNCSSVWSKIFSYTRVGQARTLELFGCDTPHERQFIDSDSFTDMRNTLVYRIEIRSNGSQILDSHNPLLWLVYIPDTDTFERTPEVRAYLPPFQLVRGSHVESQAKLIIRKLIKSSIMKEIILNAEPEYDYMPLYPIVSSSVVPLNASDTIISSATIRASLAPGLMYLQTQVNKTDLSAPLYYVCDFVEDYRSSSVLDVIGSVGGLFALLQAMNVLLFGRPLLWGLTGAKLITPFGLLGACSSRGFKRRLREEYHTTSPDDGMETIRIVKFLRDFVIEFGPADLEVEQPASQESHSSSTL